MEIFRSKISGHDVFLQRGAIRKKDRSRYISHTDLQLQSSLNCQKFESNNSFRKMAGLLMGTWSLISSSGSIINGARQLSKKIKALFKYGELSDHDQHNLILVQRRVECLVPSLNLLILWSRDKDSCVQPIIRSAQEVLQNVLTFLDKEVTNAPMKAFDQAFSDCLEQSLEELQFACNSVNLAVSIAHHTLGPGEGRALSPSSLLRASRRIQEMATRGGDVCVC